MWSGAFVAKRTFWTIFLCLSVFLLPLPSYALTIQEVPNPQSASSGWVTDMAQLISPDTQAKLNEIISELEHQTGDEIAIVTVPETTPAPSPKAFATKLFNYWNIGRNGLLFLVSKSDRRVEIVTGYGIESILPNAQVRDIVQDDILPEFKQGNFEGAILAGTKSLISQLGGNITAFEDFAVTDTSKTASSNQSSGFVALGILLITALVVPSVWWFSSINRRSGFIDSNSSEVGSGESVVSRAGTD